MTFREALKACPLVASVQASPGSPLADPQILWPSAQASLDQGVKVLRLQGLDAISWMRPRTSAPLIGLIKKDYPGSDVYITPTEEEVRALIQSGCEVIALDATLRPRPGGASLPSLVSLIREAGLIAMGDCDSLDSVRFALESGCQVVSTTLAGYTTGSPAPPAGPDLDLLRQTVRMAREWDALALAEGRYQEPWEVRAALACGADGVVVGGALNDPVKQTKRLMGGLAQGEKVGAVDLGGTWLRFGVVSADLRLVEVDKTPTPATREARLEWVAERAAAQGISRVGIGAGGTVDPATGEVWEAKDFIPDYRGTVWRLPGLACTALNDGLATAWGHAHSPRWAGKRAAALALGTGVGAGLVDRGRLMMGPRGEYPRWNDLPLPGGRTIEEALGGLALSPYPSPSQRALALEAARQLVRAVDQTWLPDAIVVTGGVGLSDWLWEGLQSLEARAELAQGPAESGLIGAAALALYPPFA